MSDPLRTSLLAAARRERAPDGALARTLERLALPLDAAGSPPQRGGEASSPVDRCSGDATQPRAPRVAEPLPAEGPSPGSSLAPPAAGGPWSAASGWALGGVIALGAALAGGVAVSGALDGASIAARDAGSELVVSRDALPGVVSRPPLDVAAEREQARAPRGAASTSRAGARCGTLGDEVAELGAARDRAGRGDLSGARSLLDAYLRRCPSGQMREDARVLRVRVLLDAGACAEARRGLAALTRELPGSAAVSRLREAEAAARCVDSAGASDATR